MTDRDQDAHFMRMALRLGRRGLGRTSPNPPVGAVVVKDGEVVGWGYHRRAGEPHAEVEALRAAGDSARGGTIYVTLEPCNHHGRTPPCTEAVRASGIQRVVIGVRDPNPHVKGGGVERLCAAGLNVTVGVEERDCAELIAPFTKHSRTDLPLVVLKLAASLDGRIATSTGSSRWITSEPARRYVHRLRNQMDAVLVGAGTILADDPLLTCRLRGGRDPLRVVVDARLRVQLDARIFSPPLAPGTLVFTGNSKVPKARTLARRGVQIVAVTPRGDHLPLRRVLSRLAERGILSVMIEGGARLAASALREGLVDRLLCFVAPKIIGGDGRPMIADLGVKKIEHATEVGRLEVRRFGPDLLLSARLSEF